MHCSNRKIRFGIPLAIVLLITILIACQPTSPTPVPILSPTMKSVPTEIDCPHISIDTPDPLSNLPIVVVALVEQQGDDDGWQYEKRSFEILNTVFIRVAEPEDRLITFSLGPRKYMDAILSDIRVGNIAVSRQNIPLTPTQYPSVTPTDTSTPSKTAVPTNTPTPTSPGSNPLIDVAATRNAAATQTSVAGIIEATQTSIAKNGAATQTSVVGTATRGAFLDECGRLAWATANATQATQWAVTKGVAIETFTSEVGNVSRNPNQGESYSNEVYFGLSHATRKFVEYGCVDPSKPISNSEDAPKTQLCFLLIFSDMDEWQTMTYIEKSGLRSKINLSNVNVGVIMLNCIDMSSDYCLTQKARWSNELVAFGANVPFFINQSDVEFHLENLFRR